MAVVVDVTSGMFPCQPFSQIGMNISAKDARGVLVWAIVRYTKRALPRVAILGNARGILVAHTEFLCNVIEAMSGIKEPK